MSRPNAPKTSEPLQAMQAARTQAEVGSLRAADQPAANVTTTEAAPSTIEASTLTST